MFSDNDKYLAMKKNKQITLLEKIINNLIYYFIN